MSEKTPFQEAFPELDDLPFGETQILRQSVIVLTQAL
jgi:hypothetical protein